MATPQPPLDPPPFVALAVGHHPQDGSPSQWLYFVGRDPTAALAPALVRALTRRAEWRTPTALAGVLARELSPAGARSPAFDLAADFDPALSGTPGLWVDPARREVIFALAVGTPHAAWNFEGFAELDSRGVDRALARARAEQPDPPSGTPAAGEELPARFSVRDEVLGLTFALEGGATGWIAPRGMDARAAAAVRGDQVLVRMEDGSVGVRGARPTTVGASVGGLVLLVPEPRQPPPDGGGVTLHAHRVLAGPY